MPFQHSCFVSYRHTQVDIVQELVKSLKTELSRWVDLDVYIDKERLKGGDFYNAELAKALCESVCLIVVYTPTYFSSKNTYCAREFKAMETLEKQRLEKLDLIGGDKHGLIIPIVYRGDKKLPDDIKSKRHCHFFEEFQISGHDTLDNPEYAQKIKEIAEYIEERCEELSSVEDEVCRPCEAFSIPSEEEIRDWLISVSPAKPKLPSRV
jgi:hypothetical protein